MRIEPWDAGDPITTRACYEVMAAVMRADDPGGPPLSERTWRALSMSPTEPAQNCYAPGDAPGTAVGIYHMRLPDRENRRRAALWLEVHPAHRRRGIGLALLRHAARSAAEAGRSALRVEAVQGSPGEAFARSHGAKPGIEDARRVIVPGSLPAGRVASLREEAERAADGYSLVSWEGRTPDEYLEGWASVSNAMSDAPHDPGHESRVWDAQRVREHLDDHRELFGSRGYFIAAIQDATGEMAAITQVEIDPEYPRWGSQQITAVARPHRGHRLGLLVKAAMLEWLADAEPALEKIVTWNAASNKHMVAINETLGFELLHPQSRHYELAVQDVLAAIPA